MSKPAVIGQYALTATPTKLSTLLGLKDTDPLYGVISVFASHAHAVTVTSVTNISTLQYYVFTATTTATAAAGDTYTNNGVTFTVVYAASSAGTITLYCANDGTSAPEASGTLTFADGDDGSDATIAYTAVAKAGYPENSLSIAATVAWASTPKAFDAGSILVSAATPDVTDKIVVDCVKA
jgi:hypothetical protein